MTEYHKHRGYELSNMEMKSHPAMQSHKDPKVQRWHNESLKGTGKKPTVQQKEAARDWHYTEPLAQGVNIEDNWLHVEIDQLAHNLAGVRLRFTKLEGTHRKHVSLEIPRGRK